MRGYMSATAETVWVCSASAMVTNRWHTLSLETPSSSVSLLGKSPLTYRGLGRSGLRASVSSVPS